MIFLSQQIIRFVISININDTRIHKSCFSSNKKLCNSRGEKRNLRLRYYFPCALDFSYGKVYNYGRQKCIRL